MKIDRTKNLVRAAKRFLNKYRIMRGAIQVADEGNAAEDALVKALRPFTSVKPRKW